MSIIESMDEPKMKSTLEVIVGYAAILESMLIFDGRKLPPRPFIMRAIVPRDVDEPENACDNEC